MLKHIKSCCCHINKHGIVRGKSINCIWGRNIANYDPILSYDHLSSNPRRQLLDIDGYTFGSTGYVLLNRGHKSNSYTASYLNTINRALNVLYEHDLVKVILLGTKESLGDFSTGTNYRYLQKTYENGDKKELFWYFQELYSLQHKLASYNKPICGLATGRIYNSAAAHFLSIGFPLISPTARMRFNDAQMGFTPHGGSIYYLSSFHNQLGAFLALTGLPLNASDLMNLGFGKKMVFPGSEFIRDFEATSSYYTEPYTNVHYFGYANKEVLDQKNEYHERNGRLGDIINKDKKQKGDMYFERFEEPWSHSKDHWAEIEYRYKNLVRDKLGEELTLNTAGLLDSEIHSKQLNHYERISSIISEQIEGAESGYGAFSYLPYMHTIITCFYPDSMEEIIHLLQEDASPFALHCLHKIKQASPLALKLTLKMLREGEYKDFKSVMETEATVAFNKLKDPEFKRAVATRFNKRMHRVDQEPWEHKSPESISSDEVQSYFHPPSELAKLDIEAPTNALLPTKWFSDVHADCFRLWLNEESTNQKEVRENYEYEVKSALWSMGIDHRDHAMTPKLVRDKLWFMFLNQRKEKNTQEIWDALANRKSIRDKYYESRKQIIEDKLGINSYAEYVNKHIQQIFERFFHLRVANMYQSCLNAQKITKRRYFLKLKKYILENRIFTYKSEEFRMDMERLKAVGWKMMFFPTERNVSFLDLEHPDIKSTFTYRLTKCIKKQEILPKIMKRIFGDSVFGGSLGLDINPCKYLYDREGIEALREEMDKDPTMVEGLLKDIKSFKDERGGEEEAEKFWRMMNEGGEWEWDKVPEFRYYKKFEEMFHEVRRDIKDGFMRVLDNLLAQNLDADAGGGGGGNGGRGGDHHARDEDIHKELAAVTPRSIPLPDVYGEFNSSSDIPSKPLTDSLHFSSVEALVSYILYSTPKLSEILESAHQLKELGEIYHLLSSLIISQMKWNVESNFYCSTHLGLTKPDINSILKDQGPSGTGSPMLRKFLENQYIHIVGGQMIQNVLPAFRMVILPYVLGKLAQIADLLYSATLIHTHELNNDPHYLTYHQISIGGETNILLLDLLPFFIHFLRRDYYDPHLIATCSLQLFGLSLTYTNIKNTILSIYNLGIYLDAHVPQDSSTDILDNPALQPLRDNEKEIDLISTLNIFIKHVQEKYYINNTHKLFDGVNSRKRISEEVIRGRIIDKLVELERGERELVECLLHTPGTNIQILEEQLQKGEGIDAGKLIDISTLLAQLPHGNYLELLMKTPMDTFSLFQSREQAKTILGDTQNTQFGVIIQYFENHLSTLSPLQRKNLRVEEFLKSREEINVGEIIKELGKKEIRISREDEEINQVNSYSSLKGLLLRSNPFLQREMNKVRNKITLLLISGSSEEELERNMKEYIERRFEGIKLNPYFKELISNEEYHQIFLRDFGEVVRDELRIEGNLRQPIHKLTAILQEKIENNWATMTTNDANSLKEVLNKEIGFDNLGERLAGKELLAKGLFEELLGKYFLDKRNQISGMRNVKESFGNTDDEFTSKLSNNFNLANSAHATDLDEIVIKRQMHQELPYLQHWDFTELMQLDELSRRSLYGDNAPLPDKYNIQDISQSLKDEKEFSDNFPEIPKFDFRETSECWLERQMQIYIGKLFEQRFIKEKKMTKDELVAYDTDLLEELGQMKVKAKIKEMLEEEMELIKLLGVAIKREKEGEKDTEIQISKLYSDHMLKEHEERSLEGEYKALAYDLRKQKERDLGIIDDEQEDKNLGFEWFYKQTLDQQQLKPKPEIRADEYESKSDYSEELIPKFQSIDDRMRNIRKYAEQDKENKLETLRRKEAFTVLEHMLENKSNLTLKDQQAIDEYFNDPDNYSYFLRSKGAQ